MSCFSTGAKNEVRLDDEPVLNVVTFASLLAVLHQGRLDVRTVADGSRVAKYEIDNAQTIAATTRVVVVSTARGGLEIFAPVGDGLGPLAINKIASNRLLYGGNTLQPRTAVCVDDGCNLWTVIDLVNPQHPVPVAKYLTRPWFIESTMANRMFA